MENPIFTNLTELVIVSFAVNPVYSWRVSQFKLTKRQKRDVSSFAAPNSQNVWEHRVLVAQFTWVEGSHVPFLARHCLHYHRNEDENEA